MKKSTCLLSYILFVFSLKSHAVPSNPAACQKWDPPAGATWRYQVTKNYEVIKDQFGNPKIVITDGDWFKLPDWEGTKIYEKNRVYSYALPVGYTGTSRWTSKYDIAEERTKCNAVPKCSNPETIVVPAGTFSTCKWTFKDPWGHPAYTVYTAPNIPIDGNVRFEWHSPDDDRIIRYDLIEVK